MVWTKHIPSRKKIYWRYCLYTASSNCLYYSFSNETLDLSISCLLKFLLASEWALPPHFRAFSFFGSNIFRVQQKSMEDMVYIRVLKTAYIIFLSNETLDLSISCLLKFLLASEWALPPSFSCIFIFWTKHISSRTKQLWKILSIYGFYKLLILFFFQMKPLIC